MLLDLLGMHMTWFQGSFLSCHLQGPHFIKTLMVHLANTFGILSSAVGMLNYLSSSTRPNLLFAIHQRAQFAPPPNLYHEQAIKRITYWVLSIMESFSTRIAGNPFIVT